MARMSSSESGTSTRRSISVEELSEDGVNFELTFSGPSPENLERGPQGRPYGNRFHSSAEVQHQAIQNPQDHQIRRLHEHPRAIIPSYHRRMNMRVVVDLEALFPDGAYDYHTGQLVDNLDNIHIFTFSSYTQMQDLNVGLHQKCYSRTLLGVLWKLPSKKGLQTLVAGTPSFTPTSSLWSF